MLHSNRFPVEMIRSELEEIVGREYVSLQESDRLVYSTDWSWMPQMWLDRGQPLPTPDYVVHPGSAEEVSEVLQIANNYEIPVVPWGGGSGTQGGAMPLFGGILLDTKRMARILEIDEKSLTVTAEAGINLWQGRGHGAQYGGRAPGGADHTHAPRAPARSRPRFLPPLPGRRRDAGRDHRGDDAG